MNRGDSTLAFRTMREKWSVRASVSLVLLSGIPAVAALLSTTGSEPNLASPFSGPAFLLAAGRAPWWYVVLVVAGSFVVFNISTIFGGAADRMSFRMPAVAIPLFLLNVVFMLRHWSAGVAHQGLTYTIAITTLNVAIMLTLAWLWYRWRAAASPLRQQCLGLFLHTWLFWYAFPYLGEGI